MKTKRISSYEKNYAHCPHHTSFTFRFYITSSSARLVEHSPFDANGSRCAKSLRIEWKNLCDGGWDGTNHLSTVEIFDTSTNSWSTGASLPEEFSDGTASVVNGKIYAILGDVWVFDTSNNTWSAGPSIPTASSFLTSSIVNGKIYTMGGYWNSDSVLSVVQVFDPSTNTWSSCPPMPTARAELTSSVVNGKIYVIGGYAGTPISTVEVFDPGTNMWSECPSMPTARTQLTSSVLNGKIYAIAGFDSAGTNRERPIVEIFDPLANSWSEGPPILTSCFDPTSSVLNGKIYLIGGWGDDSGLSSVEVFDTDGNSVVQETQNVELASILLDNHPNPASSSTSIEFVLPTALPVSLDIFNALGMKMENLLDQVEAAGEHFVPVDLKSLPDGMYYYRIQAGDMVETARLSIEH
jgi:N-acetylneuraminic acid mutarotase